jgi:hypothetical protein
MRLIRGLLGALMWLGAALLGLVGVLLCATLILIPLGVPLLGYARRLFTSSVRMMLPKAVAHPVKELKSEVHDEGHDAARTTRRTARRGRKAARKASKGFA